MPLGVHSAHQFPSTLLARGHRYLAASGHLARESSQKHLQGDPGEGTYSCKGGRDSRQAKAWPPTLVETPPSGRKNVSRFAKFPRSHYSLICPHAHASPLRPHATARALMFSRRGGHLRRHSQLSAVVPSIAASQVTRQATYSPLEPPRRRQQPTSRCDLGYYSPLRQR